MNRIIYPGKLKDLLLDSNTIAPGSKILLRGGNYLDGDLLCQLNNVTITNYPNEQATIVPTSGYRCLFFGENAHDIVLDGLIIDGENVVDCIKITDGATNITIKNCEIRNANKNGINTDVSAHPQGILITNSLTTGITIENCYIHHNGTFGTGGYDHGIYCSSAGNITIKNCELSYNGGHGIHIFGSNDNAINMVDSNYTHHNGEYGIGCYYGQSTIQNNVSRYNSFSGMRIAYNAIIANVYNNTLLDHPNGPGIATIGLGNPDLILNIYDNVSINNSYGVLMESSILGQVINVKNNLYSNNSTSNYQNNSSPNMSIPVLSNNLTSAFTPIVDDLADNIIPSIGNPAKGSGLLGVGVVLDKGGNTRSNPSTIGAWE